MQNEILTDILLQLYIENNTLQDNCIRTVP